MINEYIVKACKNSGEIIFGYPVSTDTDSNSVIKILDMKTAETVEVRPETVCRCLDSSRYIPMGITVWENDKVTDGRYTGTVRYGLYDSKYVGFYIDWSDKESCYYRSDILYWLDKVRVIQPE